MNDKPKFVFNCTDCKKCCERDVTVYIDDIRDWMDRGMMYQVLPHLSIEGEYASIFIQTDRQTRDDGTVCALFDLENEECSIKDNKPLSCRSFPLGYNGKNFIVVDMDCPGLGQGEMTAEGLAGMRETAKAEFESNQKTQLVLPMLQALFVKKMTLESQRAMEELSPEKREELEKILGEK